MPAKASIGPVAPPRADRRGLHADGGNHHRGDRDEPGRTTARSTPSTSTLTRARAKGLADFLALLGPEPGGRQTAPPAYDPVMIGSIDDLDDTDFASTTSIGVP